MKYSKYSTSDFSNINVHKTINHKSFDKYAKDYNKPIKVKSKADFSGLKGVNVFAIIFCIIFIIAFANYLRTGNFSAITFKGFIEFLASAPSIDISWSIIDLTIYGDFGAIQWFINFLNWFTDMFEVMIALFGMIVQSLGYILYLIRGLFFSA